MRRLVALLLFLVMVNEGDPETVYSKHMFGPFNWVESVVVSPLPIKIRLFDIAMLGILVFAVAKKVRMVGPMRNALLLAVATVVSWFIYGMATGGDVRAAGWQTYVMLSAILTAFAVAATFPTSEHYALLGKTLVAAALYRAMMTWFFYIVYIRTERLPHPPNWIAAHDDSVLWVITILVMVVEGISKRNRATTLRVAAVVMFLVVAIYWNHRRLAWVSMIMASVMAFFMLPRGPNRKRVVHALRIIVPAAALYALVGWGRSEGIFRPLEALATVSTAEDLSTKARNAENLGLIATARAAGAVTGTGWGHGYIELTNKYSIAAVTDLWPYVPHNSILGLLAYTGVLGFMGYWLAFPTAVFLNSRVAQMGNSQSARNVGLIGATMMIVCANQMYGDMGIFSLRTMYLLATAYAIALRLPVVSGVWDAPRTQSYEAASRGG